MDEAVMLLCEVAAAVCAVAACGPCFLACARRWVLGAELLGAAGGAGGRRADVAGCDEPSCPYYKRNITYIMLPARRPRSPRR
ncbi:hypothetical protein JYU34_004834 [Plutella xylostella]|uniref:Secreted protein n=1 Tax=Plutella xylostella TaxID=51655 RepID=A0ABQ7QVB6_PLUXY|nr:hypothetical protein JYU34_004834 [Plutella xylostella]